MELDFKQEKPYWVWDVSEIIEGRVKYLVEEDGLDEEEARQDAYDDHDLTGFYWESMIEGMDEVLKTLFKGRHIRAEVNNFGWRGSDFQTDWFLYESPQKMLDKILPKTDCTFKIWLREDPFYGKHLTFQNFHHDSPVGNEWYKVYTLPDTEELTEKLSAELRLENEGEDNEAVTLHLSDGRYLDVTRFVQGELNSIQCPYSGELEVPELFHMLREYWEVADTEDESIEHFGYRSEDSLTKGVFLNWKDSQRILGELQRALKPWEFSMVQHAPHLR